MWMIYQTLLRHRELPIRPMIPRFPRASIPSQTVMPCNQILAILSVGPNHLGSYLISLNVNTSVSPAKKSPVQPTYIINETPLESCDTEKDLGEFGVWVSRNLTSDKKGLNSVRKPTNSLALCAELLGTPKAPKRVVHFIFLSFGAISAMQPKYGRHSPLAY